MKQCKYVLINHGIVFSEGAVTLDFNVGHFNYTVVKEYGEDNYSLILKHPTKDLVLIDKLSEEYIADKMDDLINKELPIAVTNYLVQCTNYFQLKVEEINKHLVDFIEKENKKTDKNLENAEKHFELISRSVIATEKIANALENRL